MITKLISGCQIGADQAGLRAAKDFGISTGGYVTQGNKTLDGFRPDLIKEFNLIELDTNNYKLRTWSNVSSSDGTIRFATDFNSRGEICTLNGIKQYNKPYFDVDIKNYVPTEENRERLVLSIVNWIKKKDIHVLNVAGNADKKIESFAYKCLTEVFKKLFSGLPQAV